MSIYSFPNLDYSHGPMENRYPVVVNCSFAGEEGKPCTKAKPMLTDLGYCYALNSMDVAKLYRKSSYVDNFLKHVPDKEPEEDSTMNMRGSGQDNAFTIVLDWMGRGSE